MWTLLIFLLGGQWTTPEPAVMESNAAAISSRPGLGKDCAPLPPSIHPKVATFSYYCTTKANAVKFMHQGLCNLPNLSLIKVINTGFLQGAPHLTAIAVHKYLMPSLATSKGHMKQPRKVIRSTTAKPCHPTITITSPNLPHPIPAAPTTRQMPC